MPILGLPSVPNDLIFQAIGLGISAIGTIAGVMIPITKMLAGHRKAFNERIDGLQATLNRRVEELTHTMAAHELDDERRFGEVRAGIDTAGDIIRREFGETAHAIREHMHQMEIKDGDRRLEVERELQNTRHTLYGRIDTAVVDLRQSIEGLDARLRPVETRRRSN